MWELEGVRTTNPILVGAKLKEGYEPFAVSTDNFGLTTVWLKREVITGDHYREATQFFGEKDEIHSKQESNKGTGRRATKKS